MRTHPFAFSVQQIVAKLGRDVTGGDTCNVPGPGHSGKDAKLVTTTPPARITFKKRSTCLSGVPATRPKHTTTKRVISESLASDREITNWSRNHDIYPQGHNCH